MSPLLFNLMIETLALAIREHAGIRGVQTLLREHKLSLYADDILLFVQDPVNSIGAIEEILEMFGIAAEYKINVGKSVIMGLGIT